MKHLAGWRWRVATTACPVALSLTCLDARDGRDWEASKAALQAAICAYEVRCGFRGASEQDTCRGASEFGRSSLDGSWLWREGDAYSTAEALEAGRLALDLDRFEACLDAVERGACYDIGTLECDAILAPRVSAGEPCRAGHECVSGLCAVGHDDDGGTLFGAPGCEGTCIERIAAGASCGFGLDMCEEGSACNLAQGVCATVAGVGDACVVGALLTGCRTGLVCGQDGRCGLPGGLMAPCAHAIFPNGGCEPALTCVAATCRLPGSEGDPCENARGGGFAGIGGLGLVRTAACQLGLYCDAREGVGTCRPEVPEGAVCDDLVRCAAGLPCVGYSYTFGAGAVTPGVCGRWGDDGTPCTPPPDGSSGVTGCPGSMRCDPASQACQLREVPTLSLGDVCVPRVGKQCAEGTCDDATGRCALICR